jgi:preprotein translocase subunit SecG
MKRLYTLTCVILILFTFLHIKVSADWAYAFVVNDGDTFMISNEVVDELDVGQQVGEVTRYSDREGTYSGNFSNIYPKGTTFYAIEGISPNEAIAIKTENNSYIKATYRANMPGGKAEPFGGDNDQDIGQDNAAREEKIIISILSISVLLIIVLVIFQKAKR